MASIEKTPHYNLSQFGDSAEDKPSWRGDYTSDMSKIDSQMYRNETDATTASSTANTAKNTADSALTLAKTNESNINEQESYFTALGVTSQQTAQSLMSTINGKAENTTVTALQGTVSGLSDTVGGKANSADVYTKAQGDARYTQQGGYSGTAQTLNQRIAGTTADITALKSWRDAWLTGWKKGDVSRSNSSGVTVMDNETQMNFMYNETIKAFRFFGCVLASSLNQENAYLTLTAQLPASMRPSSDVYYAGVGFYVAGDSNISAIPSGTNPIGGWPASFKITSEGQIQATFKYQSVAPTSGENWTGGQERIYAAFTQSIYFADTLTPIA